MALWRAEGVEVSARAATLSDGRTVAGAAVSLAGPDGGEAVGSLHCGAGELVTLSAPDLASEGLRFEGWYADAGEGEAPSGDPLFAWPDWPVGADGSRASLVAAYVPAQSVTVTFRPGAAGATGEMAPQAFAAGEADTLSPNEYGYAEHGFAGWATEEGGEAAYSDGQLVRPESDMELFAVWAPGSYSISYDLAGGSEADPESPNPTSYTADTAPFSPADPVRAGHRFDGWTWRNKATGDSSSEPGAATVGEGGLSAGDLALTAAWTPESYDVAACSRTGTEATPVAHVYLDGKDESSGKFDYGTTVTLEARVADSSQWKFLGWYEATELTTDEQGNEYVASYGSEALGYTLKVDLRVERATRAVAVFDPVGKRKLTVDAVNGAEYYVGDPLTEEELAGQAEREPLVGDDPTTLQWGSSYTVDFGRKVTLTAREPGRVLYWTNNSGMVLGTGASVTLTMTTDQVVHLAYVPADGAGECFVRFVTDYNQVLRYYRVSAATARVDVPDGPTKAGKEFDCWQFEDGGAATDDTIRERVREGKAGAVLTVRPKYKDAEGAAVAYGSITVHLLDGSGEEIGALSPYAYKSDEYPDGRVPVGDFVVLYADETLEAGGGELRFAGWVDGPGEEAQQLGSTLANQVKVRGAEHLYARYTASGADEEQGPAVWQSYLGASFNGSKYVLSFTATRSVPDSYTILDYGVIGGRYNSSWNEDTMVLEAVDNTSLKKWDGKDFTRGGTYTQNLKTSDPNLVAAFRGYLVAEDAKGVAHTYYTGIGTGSYNQLKQAAGADSAQG